MDTRRFCRARPSSGGYRESGATASPASACINEMNSRRLALGPAVPQTKSGTRCGVRPAGSCLLLRPRPCTARPWYYRTVGERVARSRAACVPRLRHTL